MHSLALWCIKKNKVKFISSAIAILCIACSGTEYSAEKNAIESIDIAELIAKTARTCRCDSLKPDTISIVSDLVVRGHSGIPYHPMTTSKDYEFYDQMVEIEALKRNKNYSQIPNFESSAKIPFVTLEDFRNSESEYEFFMVPKPSFELKDHYLLTFMIIDIKTDREYYEYQLLMDKSGDMIECYESKPFMIRPFNVYDF